LWSTPKKLDRLEEEKSTLTTSDSMTFSTLQPPKMIIQNKIKISNIIDEEVM